MRPDAVPDATNAPVYEPLYKWLDGTQSTHGGVADRPPVGLRARKDRMTLDTDLATLRISASCARPEGKDSLAALARVEAALRDKDAEIERLTQERDEAQRDWQMYVHEVKEQEQRATAAERELARLREGLRPEPLARLFHETYERLAPDHGYKTREDSAVLWEDVPAANRALMIATADAVARALLADTAKDGQ